MGEDVYSSPELRSNPQPPISVLSPTRQTVGSVGYPFLFTPSNHHSQIFPIPENEKYKKLVLKKQKREGRKDKNVTVFQAQEVAGHNYDDDINTLLQSLGEVSDDKKGKVKKPKEKLEKGKVEKK